MITKVKFCIIDEYENLGRIKYKANHFKFLHKKSLLNTFLKPYFYNGIIYFQIQAKLSYVQYFPHLKYTEKNRVDEAKVS